MNRYIKVFFATTIACLILFSFSFTSYAEATVGDTSESITEGSDSEVNFINDIIFVDNNNRSTTMLEENSGLLFTALFIGILLGVGGTLLVQYFRRKKKS